MQATPRLNSDLGLRQRLADVLADADRLDVAVAYAKRSGVELLRAVGVPRRSRFVVGSGFGLTDPEAVEALATLGADVRVVVGSEELSAAAFHPKLYVVSRAHQLIVFAGSSNLTAGGLETNVEQYEELVMLRDSRGARAHRTRFNLLWRLGVPLSTLRESGAWGEYRRWVAERSTRETHAAAQDRMAAARIQALLPTKPGESSRGRARDKAACSGRLHTLLRQATGLSPEPRDEAYVRLDRETAIRARSIQRCALHMLDDGLALAVWPAELKPQANALYSTRRAARLIAFGTGRSAWRIAPTPHLAFRNSAPEQRLYLTPRLDARDYVHRWSEGDLHQAGAHPRSSLRSELWPWLVSRGYSTRRDEGHLARFERALGRRDIHLRPGLKVWREWGIGETAALEEQNELAWEIRAELADLLVALDEPPLPPFLGDIAER